jgi:hypothetical protein
MTSPTDPWAALPMGSWDVQEPIASWPPEVTSEQTRRALAAGFLVDLEAVGRDFGQDRCPSCGARAFRVIGDAHATLFHFYVAGALRHDCDRKTDPTSDHPAWTRRQLELAGQGTLWPTHEPQPKVKRDE